MSYDLYIYNNQTSKDLKTLVPLAETEREDFKKRVLNYNFEAIGKNAFEHAKWGISVSVEPDQINFSIPYGNEDTIFEGLMTASELLSEYENWVLFNPQDDSWTDSSSF